jgi:hypothetical protein
MVTGFMSAPSRIPPNGRCIALGASNLTRALPTWIAAARAAAGGPVACFVAAGNGRSLGTRSRFLGRTLPGILDSGLFDRLEGPRRGVGAILDVGNDLLYGSSVPTVLGWVETCLTRLHAHVDSLFLGGLPPVSEGAVTPLQFELLRRVLVPSCRLGLDEAMAAARELEEGLRALALAHGASFVELPRRFFGRDPIHVLARHRVELCARLTGVAPEALGAHRVRRHERVRVRLARPTSENLLGFERRGTPPQVLLEDGSTLTLD